MSSKSPLFLECPSEVLLLISERLNDSSDLSSLSRVCKYLRQLLFPNLLRTVDLSSHNDGRLPDQEDEFLPEVYADFDDYCRPLKLVTRQRAFLSLMTRRPDLASLVQSFTWTLVWRDFEEESLADIDYELWNVFSGLNNVRQLDLASIHQIDDEPFIRKNPLRLFPGVTNLRLLGWMHRGLVDAIINSLDPASLCTLRLDYLQDEGALPNGDPMARDLAIEYACTGRNKGYNIGNPSRDGIPEELYERQKSGLACVFPGPMWAALRRLSSRSCTSLTKFELKIPAFDYDIDMRNYFSCFHETAQFLSTVNQTLRSLTIVFGDSRITYGSKSDGADVTKARSRLQNILLATSLLRSLVPVLEHTDFPALTDVLIRGLRILGTDNPREVRQSTVNEARELMRNCSLLSWDTIIGEAKIDYYPAFGGYDNPPDPNIVQQFRESLEQS
ncbi:hypothetical protein FQN54_006350 [Arachnomyces sp. PD_36]|nr:hypothetical protein FQN54_006350 [Arachnomyces sp. PD_36]